MNTKLKGSRAERECMRINEEAGFACTRAAASLGLFDVICIGPTSNKLIQIKCNRWPGTDEMERIQAFRCNPINSKEVWRRDDRRGWQVRYVE